MSRHDNEAAGLNALTAAERQAGWRLLFDGETLGGWRSYRGGEIRAGWEVVEGILTRSGPGGDIVTTEQFDDFELWVDWNISPGGNSGIFYRAGEAAELIWQNALEVQVLDDAAYGFEPGHVQATGGLYALYPPIDKTMHPPGAWNQSRVVARGNSVEHWLNGSRIVAFEIGSDDWHERVAASKFAEYADFGKLPRGHIGLQDHGHLVQYRNIRIRPLA